MSQNDDLPPQDVKRRQHLVRLLSLGAFFSAPIAQSQAFWSSKPKQLAAGRSIFTMKGDVRVNGIPADLQTRIRGGDTVSTENKSEVVFVVGSDSFLLHGNSELVIEGGGFFVDTLRMLSGRVLSVFGQRNQQQPLTVNSSTATIGIRGTGIYLESEPGLTYLCTCYGQVGIASNQDSTDATLISASHHEMPRYITDRKSRGSRIRTAPFKNHSDAELRLLEALVGREVPFGNKFESDGY